MTSVEARLHLRYSAWASRKLVEAVRAVPDVDPDEFLPGTRGCGDTPGISALKHVLVEPAGIFPADDHPQYAGDQKYRGL